MLAFATKRLIRISSVACALFATISPALAARSTPVRSLARSYVAATSYTIMNLGALVGGGTVRFVPTALNNLGQIVGYDSETLANGNAGAAYLINADGTFGTLDYTGNTPAFYIPVAINNAGRSVAGQANKPGDGKALQAVSGPVTWSLFGAARSHQNYRVYGAQRQPGDPPIADIANGNVPVGGPAYFGFTKYAVAPFKTAGCAIGDFFANAINDSGRIVGSGGGYAAVQTASGCAAYFAGLRPANASTSAVAINAKGDLIVSLSGPAAPAFGAYYLLAKGALSLVPIPASLSSATYYLRAIALNGQDAIVGNVSLQTPPFAVFAPFLYQNGRSIDINALLPAKSGWHLVTAAAINDGGEIVGTGFHNGVLQGYALRP